MPIRSALQQFEKEGAFSGLVATDKQRGLVYVAGISRQCVVMEEAEWEKYLDLCRVWMLSSQDLQGAPIVSMLEAAAHEGQDGLALLKRPSHFARAFSEIETLLRIHATCIKEDECEEILRQVDAKLRMLKEAVLRAEEIWLEQFPPNPLIVYSSVHDVKKLSAERISPNTGGDAA